MNTVIVDDEPFAIEGLKNYLSKIPIIRLIGTFTDSMEASNFMITNKTDLLLLDINMPHLDGFELIQTLINKPFCIFITAHPQFAFKGFENDAVDYLLKPVSFDRLLRAVNKAKTFFDSSSEPPLEQSVFIRANGKFYRMNYDDIIMVEALKDYVKVYTATEVLMVAINLATFMGKLPAGKFIRVHRSFVINISKVTQIEKLDIMLGQFKAPIGTSYRDDVMNLILSENVIKK